MPKIATAETRLERLCAERGMRMTGQRRTIAQVLSEAEDHPDVEEVYRRASARDPRISLSTVYRTSLKARASWSATSSATAVPAMSRPATAITTTSST
jgi:Ferric uptake regulator family